ncbi:unnamed protein product, partial [Iphiclides podalirius]
MGHAVNKIIKDINNRSQILKGNRVHYIPGWDCHGLPIELKALQKAQKTATDKNLSDPVNIRQIARAFALETVLKQKKAFQSWGVMADWDKSCYLTLDKHYVQNQLRQFYKMYKSGLIFRALKPVYWSPSSKTALAEAELEYDPQFKSTEVYVKFRLEKIPKAAETVLPGKDISALIWTTTPWTLIANRAICYSSTMKYCLVTLSTKPGEIFLVASAQIDYLEKTLGVEISKLFEFDGSELHGTTYRSGFSSGSFPFLEAGHVTEGKGTGLVHTAPAHGHDDFLVALKNDMSVVCNVDEAGRYFNLGGGFDGLSVFGEGQEAVIAALGGSIIHRGVFVHSYPLDWRTKKPVIVRASQQWFVDTAALMERALAALDKVALLPPASADQSRQGFRSQLEKRPYWCISRQRAWGVPIPVLFRGDDVIADEAVIERLCSLIEEHDTDIWWSCDVSNLIPDEVAKKHALDPETLTKGNDVMDIWLDSGLSWQVLGGKKARVYCEGVDQLTGWFQTSLLTSLALTGEAPYDSLFVHGFVVDERRRKMSKSVGNVVDPQDVISGDGKRPGYGVDALRWWVASHSTQHSQVVISHQLLADCQAEVSRVRSIIRYLLGVISDLEPAAFDQKPPSNYFDRFIVNEAHGFLRQVNEHYDSFRYNHAAQSVLFFVSNKVSALYCHCVKDRLYCSPKSSAQRISAQLAAHTILVAILKATAPVLPHLVEEAWSHHPLYSAPFFFTRDVPMLPAEEVDPSLMVDLLEIKRQVCVMSGGEKLRRCELRLGLNPEQHSRLAGLGQTDGETDSVLCEVLELSSVEVKEIGGGARWELQLNKSERGQCLRCRKYNAVEGRDVCSRCENVLAMG